MGSKLFIGNIAHRTNESALENLFSGAGTVISVKIITDRDSGRSKGFGFVEMSTPEEASAVMQSFNDRECDGRPLKISEAKPQEVRSGGQSFNRRGGFENQQRRFGSR